MTVVDTARVRTAILTLETTGRSDIAAAVWDLLDAWIALDAEIITRAGESPAVQEIETLLHTNPAAERCTSRTTYGETKISVRCQRFSGHASTHTYGTSGPHVVGDDQPVDIVWADPDPFAAPNPPHSFDIPTCDARYAGHPLAPSGNLHCLQARGHSGAHRDLITDLAWENLDETIAAMRQDTLTSRRRDVSGNIIFPGQTTVEDQLTPEGEQA